MVEATKHMVKVGCLEASRAGKPYTGLQIRDKGFPLSALEYWARQSRVQPMVLLGFGL